MIGSVINNLYLIQEFLGEGGMGVVYKALDQELDRPVALKFLKGEFAHDQLLIKRLRDELKVMARFNHSNITSLYTSVSWQGVPVMVMELLDGETFSAMIERRGPIPAHISVPLFLQALAGVGEAHRRGIIHRDLKPANLMLTTSGVVKVMDFGIAKMEHAPGLTRTSTVMGTPYYIAPEQVDAARFGLPCVDCRADIYSMGVTLYELLAGEVPFQGASEFSIQRAHLEHEPPPPTNYYPHIPPPVVAAVMRALTKDPSRRFQNSEEFAHALTSSPLPAALLDPVRIPVPASQERIVPTPVPVVHVEAARQTASNGTAPGKSALPGNPDPAVLPPSINSEAAVQPARPLDSLLQTWFGYTGRPRLAGAAVALLVLVLLVFGGFGVYAALGGRAQSHPGEHALDGGRGGGGSGLGSFSDKQTASISGNEGREFHLPRPEPPESVHLDVPSPLRVPAPKVPVPVSEHETAAPTKEIDGVVAGQWTGSYTGCTDNSVNRANMSLSESPGADASKLMVSGSLRVSTNNGDQNCAINGTFTKKANRLILQAACRSATAPEYLSAAHANFLSLDQNQNQLNGIVQPDSPCVTISFKKK